MVDHRSNALAYLIELFRRSRLAQHWAPVFLWMAGIFYFSSRPDPLSFLPSPRYGIDIERLAHIGEYAGLTILLQRALREQRNSSTRLRRYPEFIEGTGQGARAQRRATQREPAHNPKPAHAPQYLCPSALMALAYALSDEIHQQLTPVRGFELADIVYDLVGIIVALGLIWVRERGVEEQR